MGQRPSRQTGRASLAFLCYEAANQDPLKALDLAERFIMATGTRSLYDLDHFGPSEVEKMLEHLKESA